MAPTAKSVIFDLLSTVGRHALPARALVAAGGLLGIGENRLRVALVRLVAAGTVERDDEGGYRLGRGAAAVQAQVRSWRRLEERVVPWDGSWIGVHVAALPRPGRGPRARRPRRALRFLGFRSPVAGLELRPANLAGGVAAVRGELVGLGLEPAAPVFRLVELEPALDRSAREAWDGPAITAAHRRSIRDLEASARQLPSLDPTEAMVESFLLGGRVIRELVLDPLLPEPIVDVSARCELREAMLDYDRLGRAAWREFLRAYGVEGREAPVGIGWDRGPATSERTLNA